MRGNLVTAVIAAATALAGCTAAGGTPGGAAPAATVPGVIGVTCNGAASDAATLQNAIDSEPARRRH